MNKQRLLAAALTIAFAMTTLSCAALARPAPPDAAEQALQEQARQLSNQHVRAVLGRLALRHDADSELLRLQLGPDAPLAGCESISLGFSGFMSPDQADETSRQTCTQAVGAWRQQRLHALLQASDLGASHLLAVQGMAMADRELRDAFFDRLYQLELMNPAVLAIQLLDPRWQPSAVELDDRLWAVAEAGQPWNSHYGENGQRLLQALLSVSAAPELIALNRKEVESLIEDGEPLEVTDEQVGRYAALIATLGIQMAQAMPSVQSITQVCDLRRLPDASVRRIEACGLLGRRMATHPDLILDGLIGGRIWQRALDAAGLNQAPAIERRRILYWQMHQNVNLHLLGELTQIEQIFQSTLRAESEMDNLALRLQAAGLDLMPPDDWVPQQENWDQP